MRPQGHAAALLQVRRWLSAIVSGLDKFDHRSKSDVVILRDAVTGPVRRPRIIDPYLAKIEEWVDLLPGQHRHTQEPRSEQVGGVPAMLCLDGTGALAEPSWGNERW